MGMSGPELPSLGGSLALSFGSLGVVCVLAWLALRALARRGIGKAAGPIRVVARCTLEPRRSIYLVEAAGRRFLLGVGDGHMTLLSELDPDEAGTPGRSREAAASIAPSAAAEARPGQGAFADVLAKALGRRA